MIVYHGGIDVIKKPDINHSYRPLDFVCSCRDGNEEYKQ
jgi:hypothetical protein